jgi:hypothetical protein
MLLSAAPAMADENNLFKMVSADPFSFLFLSSPDRYLSPRRRSQPALPALLLPTDPSLPRRAAPLRVDARARPPGRRRPKTDAAAAPSRLHPEPPSIAVQSPTLPPSTVTIQSTPPSSPFKARIVRYYFCVIYSIFSAAVV